MSCLYPYVQHLNITRVYKTKKQEITGVRTKSNCTGWLLCTCHGLNVAYLYTDLEEVESSDMHVRKLLCGLVIADKIVLKPEI